MHEEIPYARGNTLCTRKYLMHEEIPSFFAHLAKNEGTEPSTNKFVSYHHFHNICQNSMHYAQGT